MTKFKLRKGLKVGDLAAENDQLLDKVFVDQGHIEALLDTNDPTFLILGRTGSGKTALIRQIKARAEHVSLINPEDLSMQHIHNSQILRMLTDWGVNLDVFYKFLWRHVCVLDIIRMRYGDSDDVPPLIQRAIALVSTSRRDEQKAKEVAQTYLRNYGEEFWVTRDTRIRKIVDEVELRVTKDDKLGAHVMAGAAGLRAGSEEGRSARVSQRVESESLDRAQRVVGDYLIADLKHLMEMLGKAGFNDPQKKYYLLIDDLDKNWMPDDTLYLELLKSLLYSVYDINRASPLQGVKIIVALRENIYHRIFQKANPHEPQREKWLDVQMRLRWSKPELTELIDKRLAEVYREQYTQSPPTLENILPARQRRTNEEASDFIFDRTFLRPRDVIDFVNTAIADASSVSRLTWSNITRAETEYSKRRRQSLFDEWKDSYFGMPVLFPLLTKLGPKFVLGDIGDDDANRILSHKNVEQCAWMRRLQEAYCTSQMTLQEVKIEFAKALYLVGMIGVRHPQSHHVLYSYDQPFDSNPEIVSDATFHLHKMFWSSLGLSAGPSDKDS